MTAIAEVRDAVAAIAQLVDQTRTVLDALADGRAFLQKNHPDARGDLADLLEQMRVTVVGLHSASRIVTDFDFTVDGSDRDRQPARFNEHLMRFTERVASLDEDVSRLKGSCTRVLKLSEALDARANERPWWALLGDRAGQRAAELASTLYELYGIDGDMADLARRVLEASEASLREVRSVLRAGADTNAATVNQIDRAAAVLHEQADELRPQIARLIELRDALSRHIAALD